MYHFPIQPLQQFASERGSGAAIRRPKVNMRAFQGIRHFLSCPSQEVAFFSYDDNHHYHQDERSLRYYYPPTIGADLSRGFETFQQADDTQDEHLVSLLRTIIHLEKETGSRCSADIVTWRGMMTKVVLPPCYRLITKARPRSWHRRTRQQTGRPFFSRTSTALTMASFEMNATKFQVRHLVSRPDL